MTDQKPNLLVYRFTQFIAWFIAFFVFGRKVVRNEIRHAERPFVLIANHECALDFVNIIGLTKKPMKFVLSYCILNTLPVRGLAKKLGVIAKQQFQTKPSDLKSMKKALDDGYPLVIYPAGLMCEDGLTTPIPKATYKFLKWLNADVYVARSTGSYFVMPKWAKGMRAGRTLIDVYKLFDRETLAQTEVPVIREKVREALLFDAYREEEQAKLKSQNNRNIDGLENVLYMCPHCLAECSTETEKDRIRCRICGYEAQSDESGLLHPIGNRNETTFRYVSDWSTMIREHTRKEILNGKFTELKGKTKIQLLDLKHKRFVDAGSGMLSLVPGSFRYSGELNGSEVDLDLPIRDIPTLPFKPGHHIEIQNGDTIYRCVMEKHQLMMKYVNAVELFYELNNT